MSDAPVRIRCPNLTCRKVLAVPQVARGKTVRCRSCGTNIRVPMKGSGAGTESGEQPNQAAKE